MWNGLASGALLRADITSWEGDMQFSGKVVLVTGAQQGIGRAMALESAAAGADVAINWFDDDGAGQRVADDVRACGRRADLGQGRRSPDRTSTGNGVRRPEGLGVIDVLINNAEGSRAPFSK
jgi:3-oxoacyl-[acyl-carrier protein] reductase